VLPGGPTAAAPPGVVQPLPGVVTAGCPTVGEPKMLEPEGQKLPLPYGDVE